MAPSPAHRPQESRHDQYSCFFDLDWLDRASLALDQDAVRERIRTERKRLSQQGGKMTRQGELPEFVSQALQDPAGQG